MQVRKQAFQWYKQTLKFVDQTLSNRKRFIDGQSKQMLEFSCFLMTQNPRILPTGPDLGGGVKNFPPDIFPWGEVGPKNFRRLRRARVILCGVKSP